MKYTVSMLALLVSATAAVAADAIISAPVVESRIKGAFEIGGSALRFSNTDDDVTDTLWGGYASAFANVDVTPRLIWSSDLQFELLHLSDDEEWDENAPNLVAVAGSSLNVRLGHSTIGAFGSFGTPSQYDEAEDQSFGWTGGVLLTHAFTADTTLTGHAGWADIRVDDDDNGFTGYFIGGSVIHGFSDGVALAVAGGYGHANEGFEDDDGSGHFWNVGIKGAFKVSSDLPIFATASYDYRDYTANTEDDGNEHAFRLGLAIALGGAGTAKDTFNAFQTPTMPYRAAAWGAVLD
ncbi:hypothetical protein EJC49_10670 [Aquibium carbonis]|uniref:Porin n=1 Tax=Aquibium carbonis TaxID=2495581 RepID=A0A3S0A8W6_9HYPH|nr:hypothetical protein [Aquibium carbonis]RST86440.1 hypothetical protein EJC49_10670 [Aquibium carbonis]